TGPRLCAKRRSQQLRQSETRAKKIKGSRGLASGEQVFDDVARHVGQAQVEPLEFHREPFVVDAEQVQDRGVQIVHVDDIFHRVVAEFVRRSVSESALD